MKIFLFIVVVFIVFTYIGYRKNKGSILNINDSVSESTFTESIFFNVAGVTFKNRNGDLIQKLIDEYLIENAIVAPFDDLTNKDILQYYVGDRVYEYNGVIGYDEIHFEPEPNNPHDPNAILVVHESLGEIGYVPESFINKVRDILDQTYSANLEIVGGRYKEVVTDDNGKDTVKTVTDTYGICITINY